MGIGLGVSDLSENHFEDSLRAMGQSKIEKTLQVRQMQELVTTLSTITERAGFELYPPQARFIRLRRTALQGIIYLKNRDPFRF